MRMGLVLSLLTTSFIGSWSFAYDRLPGNKYFSIEESTKHVELVSESEVSPLSHAFAFELVQSIAVNLKREIDLLTWSEHNSNPPLPPQKYVREHHFGTWIDFPNDDSCLTTRGLVLERDSKVPVETYEHDHCYVSKGRWYDPYTNDNYSDAREVQIDHVVPLKEAYISGAFKWSWKQRCAYFNFLGNSYHLMPIESSVNGKKSDKGPDRWMPPNEEYYCQYISNWLRIKAIWQLMMSEDEVHAIGEIIENYSCDPNLFKVTSQDLKAQRALVNEIADECPNSPP
jgi:hypothetical protein